MPSEAIEVLGLARESAAATKTVIDAAATIASKLFSGSTAEQRCALEAMISRIVIHQCELEIILDGGSFETELLGPVCTRLQQQPDGQYYTVRVDFHAARHRPGSRLILESASAQQARAPIPSLVKAVARAHEWYESIVRGELSGSRMVSRVTGLNDRYVSRILQCAFAAPVIVDAILNGTQPAALTINDLATLPGEWDRQRKLLAAFEAESLGRLQP